MRRCAHVMISGRVQGVGYRAWTADEAERRGLDGWVRNRADGRVEAVIAGDDAAIAAMIAALWSGPALAHVTNVAEDDVPEPGPGFRVLPTARNI